MGDPARAAKDRSNVELGEELGAREDVERALHGAILICRLSKQRRNSTGVIARCQQRRRYSENYFIHSRVRHLFLVLAHGTKAAIEG